MAQKFFAGRDYTSLLNRLKVDFDEKYKKSGPSPRKEPGEFVTVRDLGAGAFGKVKLVKRRNEYFAMKCLSKQDVIRHKQVAHTLNEKRILQSINFPFLVSMVKSFKDNTTLYLVMPFINGGDLFGVLRRLRKFDESLAKFYGAQVLLGLEYLHHMNLIYRDLKPENIMVDADGYLKITDFGFCKLIEGRTYTLCGTPEYIAPEIILNKPYGKAVDWWSFGILLYEMMAGYSPFSDHAYDHMKMYSKITAGKFRFPPFFEADARNLISNILQVDLTRRYGNLKNGIKDIKQHAWFRPVDFTKLLNRELPAGYVPKTNGPEDSANFDSVVGSQESSFSSNNLYEKEFSDF